MIIPEKLKTASIKIWGILLLFIFLLAIFLLIAMPFELRRAISSQKWEQRELLIKSSELVYRRASGNTKSSHSLKIVAVDTATNKSMTISDVMYGDFPFTFSVFSKAAFSSNNKYIEKYPARATVIGYKDPESNKYVLEKGKTAFPIIAISMSAIWLLTNILIMRKNKSQKKNIALNPL